MECKKVKKIVIMHPIIDGIFKIKPDLFVVLMTTCANNILNDYVLAIWQKK